MSGTTLHTTDRYSLHVVGRLDGPLVLVIVELQLHTRLCIVEEAECVRRALREAKGTGLWIGIEGGRRIKYVLRVTPFEGRSRIRAWYETIREAERLKISEARKAGELERVVTDGAILRVLAAHSRYWKKSIKTLEAIEDGGDEEDFETFYDILERSAMRLQQGGSVGDRRNDPRGRNERGGYGVSSEPYPKSPDPKAARSSISRGADDRASTPRNSCVYCRGENHIKRDCPDLRRAIDEGLVVDDRKYVKWADGLGDVSMFPSMKENVEARRVKPSKEKAPVRSQSIKITFEGDMATIPIRVAATKSARVSTSKKTDTDYVMTEKDGQRVDGEEVILSPRKRGVKKFLMKSSLDEIDTVEPLRRALRQPMQCSILEYLAASKPARDELQMITRKTRIPLSEEGLGAPKAEAPTVAVTGMTARADRMATVLLDGMKGVPPDKFYILGSGAVKTIINDGAILDAVIDNDSETVIVDEDLAVQVGLGLDRSYLFEIETVDGRKQQITGVCYKAAIEVQGVRVTLPVFAVKNCSSDLLLGRTWLSHVHAVTIERPDGSQTLSIRKPDGTRVMIETVEPQDPRNRATLAVGARPSDQIKSLPISGRAGRFCEKKYGPLLTEEEGRIIEVEDLGSRLIVDGNSYPEEKDEEFGGVVSVSFFKGTAPYGGLPKRHKRVAQKVKPAAVSRERSPLEGISEEEIAKGIKERKRKESQRLTEERIAGMDIGDGNLTPQERERVIKILKTCDKAIAFSDAERGRVDPRYAKPARIYTIPHVHGMTGDGNTPRRRRKKLSLS
eukprot:GBG77704.1 hypothetical protein CBR_g24151 [Chara braunii]